MSSAERYGPVELDADIDRMLKRHPFLSCTTIGRSVWGKPLRALRIGGGAFHWHFNGACHANEWITSWLLMRFLESYCEAVSHDGRIEGRKARHISACSTLWIVPMVNPDGVELVQRGIPAGIPYAKELLQWNGMSQDFREWKANARGVDLNDQFPAGWETERNRRRTAGPGPRDYGGPSPLSEPEARALAEWTREKRFDAVLALHTQGEEIYWNYRGFEPPEAESWAERLSIASGYRPIYLEGSDAGYKDWFIREFGRPGYTVEAGCGRNPLPAEDAHRIAERLNPLLVEALSLPGRIQT